MAGWKKIIHSGSDAHLNDLYLSGDIIHAGDTDTKIQFNTDIINLIQLVLKGYELQPEEMSL